MHKTSLYVGILQNREGFTLKKLRENVFDYLRKHFTPDSRVVTIGTEQSFAYKEVLIEFRTKLLDDGKVLVAFFPGSRREDVRYWNKTQTTTALDTTLQLCDIIGDSIRALIDQNVLMLNRASGDKVIDFSNWDVVFPLMNPAQKKPVKQVVDGAKQTGYTEILAQIPRENDFYIYSQDYTDGTYYATVLQNVLKEFGKIEGPRNVSLAKAFAASLHNKEQASFIFLEKKQLIERDYQMMKSYFDTNKIPSQYIQDINVDKLGKWPGVRANFLLELMRKKGADVLQLRSPGEIIEAQGYLCLSDIESSRNLFGALFVYAEGGHDHEEEVQIYEDISFGVDEDRIHFAPNAIETLSNKIHLLINRPVQIDLVLTKQWTRENLEKLVVLLKAKSIVISKAYFVSTKTARFVDSSVLFNVAEKTKCPYIILGKSGYIRTCTEIRTFSTLSSLYVELAYPFSKPLEEKDLKKILWLTKKRIYRLQEFYVLKIPEPMKIFANLRKMNLGKINTVLKLPLRLLV